LAVFSLPDKHRKRMRTTNSLERFNQEIKRRIPLSGITRIFPNAQSCLRLVAALSMEQSEDWITGHKYMTFESEDFEPINRLKEESRNTKSVSSDEQFCRKIGT